VRDSYQRLKQFTADASHELRNPLAVIQTNVQVALSDPDPDFQRDQLRVIERLTRRLGRLVDDLLFLARHDGGITPLRNDAVALDELLQEVMEEQQAIAIDKAVNLSLTIPDQAEHGLEACRVEGDRDQLIRLFTNLVSNAIQYTPPNGAVNLMLQSLKMPTSLQWQVRVQDSGIGIPAEAMPYVFDRFYRVDPARTHTGSHHSKQATGGSGLGLAIARVIVENHHGQIAIDSKPNQGTTFTVTLPSHATKP
jgi:two-component system, OmpR family, manganese sensing sensor histidine kinase